MDLCSVPSAALVLAICAAVTARYMPNHFPPRNLQALLEALNSPLMTHTLALVSGFVDIVVTSLSLTFVPTRQQGIIASLACISILCSIWLLLLPPKHLAAIAKSNLLSVRKPLTAFYRFALSMMCDTLLDAKQIPGREEEAEEDEPDYLLDFKFFLYDS